MPAFGRDGLLTAVQISTLADYVRSLSGLAVGQNADLPAGAKLFVDNCAACHGDNAKGNPLVGAPDLTSKIWLYGSDKSIIVATLTNGRGGVMPAWGGRLDPTTIKALAVYVHTLGGGQ
jgi:cytochrome c oxidase cbb3-type subunit 3